MPKKVLVIGASENSERYSNKAVLRLIENKHDVVALGLRQGVIDNVKINTGKPELKGIDTVTLYVNPIIQRDYYDYIIGLKPQRIIFNPGTENPELEKLAEEKGIEVLEACTLVMLATKIF